MGHLHERCSQYVLPALVNGHACCEHVPSCTSQHVLHTTPSDYGHVLAALAEQFVPTQGALVALAGVLLVYGAIVTFAVKLNGMMLRIPMVYYKLRQGRVRTVSLQPAARLNMLKFHREQRCT